MCVGLTAVSGTVGGHNMSVLFIIYLSVWLGTEKRNFDVNKNEKKTKHTLYYLLSHMKSFWWAVSYLCTVNTHINTSLDQPWKSSEFSSAEKGL